MFWSISWCISNCPMVPEQKEGEALERSDPEEPLRDNEIQHGDLPSGDLGTQCNTRGAVPCRVVPFRVMSCRPVSSSVASCRPVSCHVVSCPVVSFSVSVFSVSYHVTLCSILCSPCRVIIPRVSCVVSCFQPPLCHHSPCFYTMIY